jgi:HAD superfamily hydrolase (TIGR01490 family)
MTAVLTKRIAFFDVDETVITAKSMFEFLRFHLAAAGDDGGEYEERVTALRALARTAERSEVNRAYYRYYAGTNWAELLAQGIAWYAEYRVTPGAFVAAGRAAVARHRAAGDRIVLVSGSFLPCLRPVADEFGADQVQCTEPVIDPAGRLTGEVLAPMIGLAKGAAVSAVTTALGARRADTYGYADHASDLDMLRAVGNPTVVGHDPVLLAYAAEKGWQVV